jgi:hypothetical protein
MMKMFYAPDAESADRARRSQFGQRPDTFSGVDVIDQQVRDYTGIVHGVEDYGVSAPRGRRWRVLIGVAE